MHDFLLQVGGVIESLALMCVCVRTTNDVDYKERKKVKKIDHLID